MPLDEANDSAPGAPPPIVPMWQQRLAEPTGRGAGVGAGIGAGGGPGKGGGPCKGRAYRERCWWHVQERGEPIGRGAGGGPGKGEPLIQNRSLPNPKPDQFYFDHLDSP
jgi:hypothetical protein